ncbi:MAG TPA: PilZ domain-containing protein [Longimicrobiaceae bacterium]|nr:PilZ domain-containing protein [Longimicrobiaceae bacterium]
MPISVSIERGGEPFAFASSVLDFVEDQSMVIAAPLGAEDAAAIHTGDEVIIDITLPNGIRRFTSVVRGLSSDKAGLRLDWPEIAERIQRRNFVRIDCLLETEVAYPNPETGKRRRVVGNTADLSGGGMRVILEEAPRAQTLLKVKVHFPDDVVRDYKGRVVRTGRLQTPQGKPRYWVAVEFLDLSVAERNEIAKFVFEVQREQLRKGVA